MDSLTTLQNVQKDVRISFYLVDEPNLKQRSNRSDQQSSSISSSSLSRYFPSGSGLVDEETRRREKPSNSREAPKKYVSSAIISQRRAIELFEENSFVLMALNAKIQHLERYKSWNILQQDVPSKKSAPMNEEEEEEHDAATDGNGEVRLSDGMKKYHELPLTIPTNQFTETATRVVGCLISSDEKTEKRLKRILTKEETLETISLCNYLGIKTFCA